MAVTNAAKTASRGGYAYFPGTGPAGKTCKDCSYAARLHPPICLKAREMRTQPGGAEHKVRMAPIDTGSFACKYFLAR
jgi:hypothetical protein